MWELDYKESWAPKNWCFWTVVLEKTLESPLNYKEIQPVHSKGDHPGCHWKDWCWSWNSNLLATWGKELTHWKRPWRWERLKAGGEEEDRGWDGWMASPTQWTWVWVDSRSWWWTGRPGMLQFMGSKRVRHNWATELNWTELSFATTFLFLTFLIGPSLSFSWYVWLMVYQFYLSFQRTMSVSLIFILLFSLHFIYFSYNFSDFFPPTNITFCLFLFFYFLSVNFYWYIVPSQNYFFWVPLILVHFIFLFICLKLFFYFVLDFFSDPLLA